MDPNKKNASASTCETVPQTIWLARRLNQHDEKRYPNNPCPRLQWFGLGDKLYPRGPDRN